MITKDKAKYLCSRANSREGSFERPISGPAHLHDPACRPGGFARSRHTTAWLHLDLHWRTTALAHVPGGSNQQVEVYSGKRALGCRRSDGRTGGRRLSESSRQFVERMLSGTNFRKCGTAMHISSLPSLRVAQWMDSGWRSKSPGRASEAPKRAPAFRPADRFTFWLWPTDGSVTSFPKGCWARPDP